MSNNGSQHLAALTRDDITAPHVNLIPQELPGDLYKYVAVYIWKQLEEEVETYTPFQRMDCERFIDNIIELKKQIHDAELNSDHRRELVDKFRALKAKNGNLMKQSAPVFWCRITDMKDRRKIIKRNVMTIPYGGTAYGLGDQQISDSKRLGISQLLYAEHSWLAYMGKTVFLNCQHSLERPMKLLTIFEVAGYKAENRGEFLKWTVPITKFPVVQHYTEGKVKKRWIQYGPPLGPRQSTGYYINTLQLAIAFIEDTKPSKRKQSQGAAPNAIHSLDAAHLMMIVNKAPFPVTTVHDSFGCLLADMPDLYRITRETFLELYKENPLPKLLEEVGGHIEDVDIGELDINSILDSEYCFS